MAKYERPVLKQVELVADQSVLGNCKASEYTAVNPGDLPEDKPGGWGNCESGSNQCITIGS